MFNSVDSNLTLSAPVADAALTVGTSIPKPRVRVEARSSRYTGGLYDGASKSNRLLETWNVALSPPEPAGGKYARDTLTARIRDLENNDPLARSAIERRIDNVIGHGWGLSSKPNHKALGISFDEAVKFAETVECLWEEYTDDLLGCFTVEEDYSFPQIMAMAYRSYYRDGEAFALLPMVAPRPGHKFATRIQLVDPDRVGNPQGAMDSRMIRRGVEVDTTGRAIACHIREGHPADFKSWGGSGYSWRRQLLRSTSTGRPLMIRHIARTRIGQLRGVSRLAPVVKGLRAVGVFDDAELQTKVTNAVLTGFITSNHDLQSASEALTFEMIDKVEKERFAYYKDNPSNRKNPQGGRFPVLPSGDTYTPVNTARDTGEGFVDRVVHSLAAAAGLTYEQLTMRWDKLNYSAARGALLEIYKDFRRDQKDFALGFLGHWFYAWMEECFATGLLTAPEGAPAFNEAPAAYSRFKPILPPRGWVDPVKEATAAGIRLNLDLTSLEDEAAEQGRNWKDILFQKARERQLRVDLKLPVQNFRVAMSTNSREDKSETRDMDDNEHLAVDFQKDNEENNED